MDEGAFWQVSARLQEVWMPDWFETFAESLWLKPDETGAADAQFLCRALRLRQGQAVLDAPCGAGRIAFPLAQAGLQVTGGDRMETFLRRARARFRRPGLEGRFLRRDLREIDFDNEFDAVINWGGSFGYFSDEENLEVLRRYARALKPGGRLLLDQPNRERMLRHFLPVDESEIVTIRNRWDPQRQRVESVWRVNETGEEYAASIRLHTPAQMRRMLRKVGLEVEGMYGSSGGEACGRGTRRMVVVGSEPRHRSPRPVMDRGTPQRRRPRPR
jgi:SAM-dependent methyltransferase